MENTELHYIIRTRGTCLSVCCHSEHHDPCVTGSFIIARQFDTFEEAEREQKKLQERWPNSGPWMIAVQESAGRQTIILTPQ